jgi:hypothetical protein
LDDSFLQFVKRIRASYDQSHVGSIIILGMTEEEEEVSKNVTKLVYVWSRGPPSGELRFVAYLVVKVA